MKKQIKKIIGSFLVIGLIVGGFSSQTTALAAEETVGAQSAAVDHDYTLK